MINKRKQAHDKLQPDNNQERPLVSLGKDKKPENQSPLTWFSLQPHGGQKTGQWGISRVDHGGRGHGQGDETRQWPIKTGGSGGDMQMIFRQYIQNFSERRERSTRVKYPTHCRTAPCCCRCDSKMIEA